MTYFLSLVVSRHCKMFCSFGCPVVYSVCLQCSHEHSEDEHIRFMFHCLSQVLVPPLLVPTKSTVCYMRVQHPVCPQYPLLLLLQHPSLCPAAHEHLLVLGEDMFYLFIFQHSR